MKHLLKPWLLLFGAILNLMSPAQNETAKWYFGQNAGLDFMTNPPTILTNGALATNEGCSTVSDAAGNLLFYTDGTTVWNQMHVPMANGTGLLGNLSTTQSALIVKKPGSSNLYYVFTMGLVQPGCPLNYSIVDMTLAAGMGSVTVKNASVTATINTEKLAGVRHCNGRDVWILTHVLNSTDFNAFLLTSAGVNSAPVISSIGSYYDNNAFTGYLKASPNGKKLAAVATASIIDLFDFDNATGIVSNSLALGAICLAPYGCEFSPDGTKLYVTDEADPNNPIHQWDLCAGSNPAIAASHTVVGSDPNLTESDALQLGVDGKIYVSTWQTNALSVINNPNVYGAGCNFVSLGQSVAPKTCRLGLPNFVNDFFKLPQAFTYTVNCSNVSFTPPLSSTVNVGCNAISTAPGSLLWMFGDPGSGPANSSTLASPVHNYSAAGTYTVKLVRYYPCSSDTISLPITITNAASLGLTGSFSMCKGESRTYTVSGANTYTWSNGANTTTLALSPTVTTGYSVTGTASNSCQASKLFTITVSECVGIEALAGDENPPRLYPNPVNGTLCLEAEEKNKIIILNQMSSTVFEATFEAGKHAIDMSSFSSGMYTIKLVDDKRTRTTKIIKTE